MPKSREIRFHNPKSGSALAVEVCFGAKEEHVKQVTREGALLVSLRATKGWVEDNLTLIKFLASVLNVKPSQLEIVAGENESKKLIAIIGLDPQAMERRLRKALGSSERF